MLGMSLILTAGGNVRVTCKVTSAHFDFEIPDDEIWEHYTDAINRSFYSTLAMGIEAMCHGFCKARGGLVVSSSQGKPPQFMDYVNSGLRLSTISDSRKPDWRAYFEAVRILRNKCSYYDTLLTQVERDALVRAGLSHHIGDSGHVWTNPTYSAPILTQVLAFVQEIDQI